MMLSRYHVVTAPFLDQQDGFAKRMVFATRTAERRVVDLQTWEHIQQGDLAALPPQVVQDLVAVELLVPAEEDELVTILRRNQAAIDKDDVLWLVVQPTALCQMGCDYCGQHHEDQQLSPDNQDRLVERARADLQTRSYSSVQVSWFGAEPLLGLRVMRAMAPRLRALADEFHCKYGSLIVTNGLELTETAATELVRELGVREFEITLDGPAKVHDQRRPTKGGGGTFDRIFANVVSLARREDLDAAVLIRCNVDRRNVHAVSPFIQALADTGALHRLRDFYLSPVHDWGNDAGRLALTKEEFAEHETRWLAELVALGFVSPRLIPRRKEINCLALAPHAVLVDPYGQLFNCTEASLVPAPPKRIPETSTADQKGNAGRLPILPTSATYVIGQLRDGEQPGRRDLLGDFNTRVARGEYSCPTCRMLPVCGGACPKNWLEGRVPCPSANYNIEERLLLSYAVPRLSANRPPAVSSTMGP